MIKSTPAGQACGSSLQGYITTTYDYLRSVLGEDIGGSDKTTAEWIVTLEDGSVATIYDWKTGSTPEDLYEWHIGGYKSDVVEKVAKALNITEFRLDEFKSRTRYL